MFHHNGMRKSVDCMPKVVALTNPNVIQCQDILGLTERGQSVVERAKLN